MLSTKILIFSFLMSAIYTYRLDLSNAIPMGSKMAISTLDFIRDEPFNSHFYVGFVDGTVRKINADLSSGQTFQAFEQVDKFYNHYIFYNHTLSNGTINTMSNFFVAAVSNNHTTLKVFTANNFTQVYSYIHN